MKRMIKNLANRVLGARGYEVARTFNIPREDLLALSIPGWFAPDECLKLYQTILMTDGDILEIGHFLGKSTASICEALRLSGKDRVFNSYDLGFTSEEEFKKHYDEVQGTEIAVPSMYRDLVYSKGKTTTDLATEHLKRIELDRYVNLTSGDFIKLDQQSYDVVFCDALHDSQEIKFNLPHVITHSKPGCVWAFHDMNEENINLVLELAECEYLDNAGSLGIFYFKG